MTAPKTETVSSLFFFSGLVTVILMCSDNYWNSSFFTIATTFVTFVFFMVITFRVKRGDRVFFITGGVLEFNLLLFYLMRFGVEPGMYFFALAIFHLVVFTMILVQIKSFWLFSAEKTEERNKQGLY